MFTIYSNKSKLSNPTHFIYEGKSSVLEKYRLIYSIHFVLKLLVYLFLVHVNSSSNFTKFNCVGRLIRLVTKNNIKLPHMFGLFIGNHYLQKPFFFYPACFLLKKV